MKQKLRKYLEVVERDINICNIEYVSDKFNRISEKDYEETMSELYALKKYLLDRLCK